MQYAISNAQFQSSARAQAPVQAPVQAQAQPSGKGPAIVAGIGAALVATVITLVMSLSGGAAQIAPADGASTTQAQQCTMIQRKLYVSTATGHGSVRLRDGNYVSPPITLSTQRQPVVFPQARPGETPLDDVITIEGNSDNVMISSDFNPGLGVFNVPGLVAFKITWKAVKGC
jgi:hypothetical protein